MIKFGRGLELSGYQVSALNRVTRVSKSVSQVVDPAAASFSACQYLMVETVVTPDARMALRAGFRFAKSAAYISGATTGCPAYPESQLAIGRLSFAMMTRKMFLFGNFRALAAMNAYSGVMTLFG